LKTFIKIVDFTILDVSLKIICLLKFQILKSNFVDIIVFTIDSFFPLVQLLIWMEQPCMKQWLQSLLLRPMECG